MTNLTSTYKAATGALRQLSQNSFVKLYRSSTEPTACCDVCGNKHHNRRALKNKNGNPVGCWEISECCLCKTTLAQHHAEQERQRNTVLGNRLLKQFTTECPVDFKKVKLSTYPYLCSSTAKFLTEIKNCSVRELLEPSWGFLFCGYHGTGKTVTACTLAAKSCIEEAKQARFIHSSQLKELPLGEKASNTAALAHCNFLIIDELGVGDNHPEWLSQMTKGKLRRLLDYRAKSQLKTIIITNLAQTDPQLLRLIDETRLKLLRHVKFIGKSLRAAV